MDSFICLLRKREARSLRKFGAGRAEKSFGIYVAQLAGLPKPVIRRATELLDNHNGAAERKSPAKAKTAAPDGSVKAAVEALAALDINQLSPVEALTKLYELQRRVMGMYQNHEMKRGTKIF
jgi:DNA mismatch repair protein MutS